MPSTDRELLSISAYAREKGVTRQYVSKLVGQGKIILVDGKIDRDDADARWRGSRDPAKQIVTQRQARARVAAEPVQIIETPIAKATADDRAASAQLKQVKLRMMSGDLVERGRYAKALEDAMEPILRAFDSLGALVGPELAAENDPRKIQVILERVIATIREDAAATLRRLISSGEETTQ